MILRLQIIRILCLCATVIAGCTPTARGETTLEDFDSGRWVLDNADVVEHLGRPSLQGAAHIKDVDFKNGVIEFDLALSGQRSYPGVSFRMQNHREYEHFYVRPHRAGLYPDALQYTPVFNAIAGWQLYHGKGMTGGMTFDHNKWIHIKLEVHGSQARVFIDNNKRPAMQMLRLKHGISQGMIGVSGPRDGSGYFSNFSYEIRDDLKFDDVPEEQTPHGTITDWQVSQLFTTSHIDRFTYPKSSESDPLKWQSITAEASGLVNISRLVARPSRKPGSVYARTVIHSDGAKDVRLSLGYSDDVSVFLNGRYLFSGSSGYHSRDPSFLGLIGYFDTVPLRLQQGKNELVLIVSETFGGWGFMGRVSKNHESKH